MPTNLRHSRLGGRVGSLYAATGGTPAAGFAPSDLAGLQLWLAADSGTYTDAARTTPATADGTAVGGWADASGTAHHAAQATAGLRPVLKTSIVNSKPVLRFDGVDDFFSVADAAALRMTTAATFFVVVDIGSEANGETLLCKGANSGDPDYLWDLSVLVADDGRLSLYNGAAFLHGTNAIVNFNTFYVLELHWDGATLTFLATGAAAGTNASAVAWQTSADALYIGQQGSVTANNISGDIAEIVCYNTALTSPQRTQVRGYLTTKYALPQSRQVLYYNGSSPVLSYQIGRAVAAPEAQTTRFKRTRPAVPVLTVGAGGTWDDVFVKDPWVLYDGGTWKMWYMAYDGTLYQIGYATSSDGFTWTKSGSNPVLTVGAGGTWDAAGVRFPMVYKDAGAVAGKRYRMIYSGDNAGGTIQIGYAYSADGISWTKGGSNPVVTVTPATWESASVICGALAKSGSTYYLYYEGATTRTFPVDGQIGVVTFTDFEGSYTKSGSNPVLARRTGNQLLTANLTAGTTTVTVASTAAFTAGEIVYLTNGGTNGQHVGVASITDATHLEIAEVANATYTTALSSRIQALARAVFPRTVYLDGSTWRMWLTGYMVGLTTPEAESTYYATSSDPVTGWALSHSSDSPPLHLPLDGVTGPWDSRSSENPHLVFDADTSLPVTSTGA